MKVRELIQKLGSLDPELEVLCYTEDDALVPRGQNLRLLDIQSVETVQAERVRLGDGTPYIKIGKSGDAMPLAVLEVVSDF